jgi:FKBP-type peptidyl-prolyl cis-trans isomerase
MQALEEGHVETLLSTLVQSPEGNGESGETGETGETRRGASPLRQLLVSQLLVKSGTDYSPRMQAPTDAQPQAHQHLQHLQHLEQAERLHLKARVAEAKDSELQLWEKKTTRAGNKEYVAKAGDTVAVHYTCSLATGQEIDSSYRSKRPVTFILGDTGDGLKVIAGKVSVRWLWRMRTLLAECVCVYTAI